MRGRARATNLGSWAVPGHVFWRRAQMGGGVGASSGAGGVGRGSDEREWSDDRRQRPARLREEASADASRGRGPGEDDPCATRSGGIRGAPSTQRGKKAARRGEVLVPQRQALADRRGRAL